MSNRSHIYNMRSHYGGGGGGHGHGHGRHLTTDRNHREEDMRDKARSDQQHHPSTGHLVSHHRGHGTSSLYRPNSSSYSTSTSRERDLPRLHDSFLPREREQDLHQRYPSFNSRASALRDASNQLYPPVDERSIHSLNSRAEALRDVSNECQPLAYDRERSLNSRASALRDVSNERQPIASNKSKWVGMTKVPADRFNWNKSVESHVNHSHSIRQSNSTHLFSNTHTIPELIEIGYNNIESLEPSLTAAFWNKVLKQMSARSKAVPNLRLPSNQEQELGRHLNQIFEHTVQTVSLFGATDLSQAIYSLTKLVDVLTKYKHVGGKSGEGITYVLRSLLLNEDMSLKKDLFRSFAHASVKRLRLMDARALSNIAYAFALIKYVPEVDDGSFLFDHLAIEAAQRRAEFNAQDISNIVWAFATLDESNAALFEAMGDHIVVSDILDSFDSQALSSTVWAYATANIPHPELFQKVANHITGLDSLNRFKPQALSTTVWAYATADIPQPKLYEKVATHIAGLDSLDRFDPQALSNTVWAYATADIPQPKLYEKVANHITGLDSLDRFGPQALSNTVWAYAKAAVLRPKLFEKVVNHIVAPNILGQFNSQALSNTVWAYATMGMVDSELFSSVIPSVSKSIDSFDNQQLANMAWAYAVANVDAPTLFNDNFIKSFDKEDRLKMKIKDLVQLYQWHLWQVKEKSRNGLPKELLQRCYKAFIAETPRVSKLQEDVVVQLSSIGLEPKEEVLMDSGYRIDAIVEVNGKTISIEVDGPSHFIGRSKSPKGSTILKRRQVPSIDGIDLVSVPYWEWDKLGNNQVKKQEYLRKMPGL